MIKDLSNIKPGDLIVVIGENYIDFGVPDGVGLVTVKKEVSLGRCSSDGDINQIRGIIKCKKCQEQLLSSLHRMIGFAGVRTSTSAGWEYNSPRDIYICENSSRKITQEL